MSFPGIDALQSGEDLEAALRRIGKERYHDRHPFHRLLHGGRLNRGQVQAWALNRYYYQSRIPMKDSRPDGADRDPELRREWSQRVIDHDGDARGAGRRAALAPPLRRHRARRGHGRSGRRAFFQRRASPSTPTCASFREVAGRGDRLVADRAVRAEDHPRARDRHARRLRFHRRGDAVLFPPAARSGAARRGVRARLREGACDDAGASAEASARRCSSSAMCCGRSSTRSTMPMCSAAASRPAASSRPRRRAWRGGVTALHRRDGAGAAKLGAAAALRRARAWLLLVPERVLFPCATTTDILQRLETPHGARRALSRPRGGIRRARRRDHERTSPTCSAIWWRRAMSDALTR